jgi:glucose/arabinose dehydrogenase
VFTLSGKPGPKGLELNHRSAFYDGGMKHLAAAVVAGLSFAAVACGQTVEGPIEPVAESPRATGWATRTVVDGLEHPWAVAFLPGGEMLITERPGRLRVVDAGGNLRDAGVEGLPQILSFGQGGLMDVSLHPRFEETRWVYLTYAAGEARANHTRMARGRLSDDLSKLEDVKVIFEVGQMKGGGQHFGSRILWLPDDTMLISIGDGGNPPVTVDGRLSRDWAGETTSHLGKTLRLDEHGEPAPANPFMADPNAAGAVYTLGHRNIQGMDIDPATGQIWATEHGARGGDELNKIDPGTDYGWPRATYSVEYRGGRISDTAALEGTRQPEIVWTPCIAPSGLAFYTGDALPEWTGDLFAGGLVLRQIRRLDFEGGQIVGQETLQFEDRIRDVRNAPDGHLYVLTDAKNGKLLRIVPE